MYTLWPKADILTLEEGLTMLMGAVNLIVRQDGEEWVASLADGRVEQRGCSPEEALGRLCLRLNRPDDRTGSLLRELLEREQQIEREYWKSVEAVGPWDVAENPGEPYFQGQT